MTMWWHKPMILICRRPGLEEYKFWSSLDFLLTQHHKQIKPATFKSGLCLIAFAVS